MTRNEYLDALACTLDFLDENTRAAALSFYAEMLDDRIEEGLPEEEAVAAMDRPETIASRLKNEQSQAENQDGINMEQVISAVADYARQAAEGMIETSEEILQKANTLAHAAAGRAEGAYQAIRDEIKKGENGDYDQHLFSCPAVDISAISLIAREIPIHIFKSSDAQIHLTYYSHPDDPYFIETSGTEIRLYPKYLQRKAGLFGRRTGKRWWNRLRGVLTIKLALPENMICVLSAETSNARITAEEIRCRAFNANTSNARITLQKMESQSCIRCKTSNGGIISESVHAAQELFLQSSNGALRITQCKSGGSCTLITSNGSITAQAVSGNSISLRSSNGHIHATLPGPITAWQIDSSTSNGRNSLPSHLPGEKPLSVHTSNGSIDVFFVE